MNNSWSKKNIDKIILFSLGTFFVTNTFSQNLTDRLLNVDGHTKAKKEIIKREKTAKDLYVNYLNEPLEKQLELIDSAANSNTQLTEKPISFSEALLLQKRNCFIESNMMKIIGEEYGLKIQLLKAENHILVRLNLKENIHINYDPIVKIIVSDAELDSLHKNNVYPLTDNQIVSIEYQHNAIKAYEKGEYNTAKKYFDKAEKLDSTNAILYFNKANLLKTTNNIEESFNMYSKAISLDSNFAQAYYNRGIVSEELGIKTANSDFKKAKKLDPKLLKN